MSRLSFAIAAATLIVCSSAQGEIFKCTAANGSTSFSFVPCEGGSASVQRSGPPPIARKGEAADYPHRLNLNAIDILRVGGRTKVQIIEPETTRQNATSAHPASTLCYQGVCVDPAELANKSAGDIPADL
jgi:hypothetical protein